MQDDQYEPVRPTMNSGNVVAAVLQDSEDGSLVLSQGAPS